MAFVPSRVPMIEPLDYAPTIPNLLRRAAKRYPTREYIVTADQRLTFAEVEHQSRQLARRLLRAGVTKGRAVGLLFPQGPDFVVAFLAVTRIGAVAVPLSTFLRGPELSRAVRHVDVDLLIAPRTLLDRDMQLVLESTWPALRTEGAGPMFMGDAPCLRGIWLVGATDRPWATSVPPFAESADDPTITDDFLDELETEVTASDRMLIVQTSGATAEPKAVVHTHGAQVRHSWTLAQLYGLTADVRTFTTMPFFWVGGLTVVLLTHLHVGAAVITVGRTNSNQMLDLIETTRPTRLLGWTLLERLRADPSLAERDLSWLPELTQLPSAAERRHRSLGMSETGGPHTAAPTSENVVDLPEELYGSFGPPVEGMEHRIVDGDTGAVLAEGVEGEILVRGNSLMEGLYKQERARTFDPDGWYRTGDRGYFRGGFLFFTGRSTEMIKTRGANVAPREVELALEALPGVQAAFVVGIPDATRGERIGALVCPDDGQQLDPVLLRDQLVEVLSSYKVPHRILVLPYDEAPWLESGKISKRGILELFDARA